MATVEQTPTGPGAGELVPARHDDPGTAANATHTGVANAKLAMWLFLSSDCLFFGAFIATYLLYRDRPGRPGRRRRTSTTSRSRR